MARKEVTLPRHTVLAPLGLRIVSFIVDLAITGATFLILFFGCSNILFTKYVTGDQVSLLYKYQVDSHLMLETESGVPEIINDLDHYETYEVALEFFYFNYLTGEGIDESVAAPNFNQEFKREDGAMVLPKDYYTVSWFNVNVLGINRDDPDAELSTCYFTYQKNDQGEYDKTKVGIKRDTRYSPNHEKVMEVTEQDLVAYMKPIYQDAYVRLSNQGFFYEVQSKINFYSGLSATIPMFIAGLICYVVIPMISKDGKTLGKMINKLGLASIKGYKYKKSQLLMRFIPYFVTLIFVTVAFNLNIVIMATIVLAIFLASVSISLATAKHLALHDLTAQTLVIDTKNSIIFENEFLELEYIEKEDMEFEKRTSTPLRDKDKYDNESEEPEISYEK